VTAIKIRGVTHQFTTMEGVLEDVVDIVLNFKQLVVRFNGDFETKILHLKASKKGQVRAEHIAPEVGVEIINPELHLATLVDDSDFEVEIHVKRGRRYVTSEEIAKEISEVGLIPVDANFSPVRRVKYAVENTRVGRRTNYDRLVLEIWTNGAVNPEEALAESSKILRKHLNPFVQYFELKEDVAIQGGGLAPEGDEAARRREMEDLLSKPIEILDLSVRAKNCLDSENVKTLRQLVSLAEPELLQVRNLGKTSLKEIKTKLTALGLSLGMPVEAGS
jgi:DNA-directed RNA polymerase subunit alpha